MRAIINVRLLVKICMVPIIVILACVSPNKSLITNAYITKEVLTGLRESTTEKMLTVIDLTKPENNIFYVVYHVDANLPGEYQLKFSFMKPSGDIFNEITKKIKVSLPPHATLVDYHIIGYRSYLMFSTNGMEDFPGEWTLNVYVNEELSESTKFDVKF